MTPELIETLKLMETLEAYLEERRGAVPDSGSLIDELQRTLSAGGKRLRPAFCYWGYRAASGADGSEIARAAASLELLHTFAVVHDDIMDRAETRRGVPTTYAARGSDMAILVGDLALVLADDLFAGCGFEGAAMRKALAAYAHMRQEVIAGQSLDLANQDRTDIDEAEARHVALLKSGRYSIVGPLVIGASLAGANDDQLERFERFATPLGEAFQLRDDLLGTFGDPRATGKSVDSDIRQGKRHVLFAVAMEALGSSDRARLEKLWGDPYIDDEGIEDVRLLIESSGARDRCEGIVAECLARSFELIEDLGAPRDATEALVDLARLAVERQT